MTPRDHRFQSLLEELRRQIASSFTPGETLPSQRELALLHSVSPSTVRRALTLLASEGAVRAESRQGWIRSPAAPHRAARSQHEALRIAIMSPRLRDEWPDYEIYPALLKEAARRELTVVEVPHRFETKRRSTGGRRRIELSRVPWNTFDVGLLIEAEDTVKPGAVILRNRPVLAVDLDATEVGIDSVAFTDLKAGAIAARHLLELGHRNFSITEEGRTPGFAWDQSHTLRRHGFELAVGQVGGLMLPRWRLPFPRYGGRLANEEFITKELPPIVKAWSTEPRQHRPTALFAITPSVIAPVMAELAKLNLRVPHDLSIVSVTWNGNFWGGIPPVVNGVRITCVDLSLSDLVRRSFDAAIELHGQRAKPKNATVPRSPCLHSTPAKLIPGDSTAAPIRIN